MKQQENRYQQIAPALFMADDAVNMQAQRLMGRQSAGNGFLRALVNAYIDQPMQALKIVSPSANDTQSVATHLKSMGWHHPSVAYPANQPAAWQDLEVLYYPAPLSNALGWQRSRKSMTDFALCGVTHTISSDNVMKQLAAYVTGPFSACDALICTSQSVLTAVEKIWDAELDYLRWRLKADLQPELPMTPIIPLGIHAKDFQVDTLERPIGRAQWGFEPDDIVILFVGRLSLHAKANPIAMYLAAARAMAQSGKTIKILECGWFANDAVRASFDEVARAAGISVIRIDGRQAGVTQRAYAVADIFVSLSDNIQETFGLTPLEAMAAGLPVVVSDWDGYRETVRDGVEGFLIKTHFPQDPVCAQDVIHCYEDERINYDLYIAHTHMLVSVDIEQCTKALVALVCDPDLRQRMGQQGRERVATVYDWAIVIKQYQALWSLQADKLADYRNQSAKTVGGFNHISPLINPGMPNPINMFQHYPSDVINGDTLIWQDNHEAQINQGYLSPALARQLGMWHFSANWLPGTDVVEKAWQLLPQQSESGMTIAQWGQSLQLPLPRMLRLAVWMHKVGLIKTNQSK